MNDNRNKPIKDTKASIREYSQTKHGQSVINRRPFHGAVWSNTAIAEQLLKAAGV